MSHVLDMNHDEAKPKAMSITLKSNGKIVKALQAEGEAQEEADEDVELSEDDDLAFLTRSVKQLQKKRGKSRIKGGLPGSSIGLVTLKLIARIFKMTNPRKKYSKPNSRRVS